MSINITLDTDSLKNLVAEGIYAQLSDEKQKEIVREAVKQLFEKKGYGSSRDSYSVFDQVVENAMRSVAAGIVTEILAEPENQKIIHETISAAVRRVFEEGEVRAKLIDDLSSKIAYAFRGDRY